MRFPQLLVFESDGRLTASLGPLAEELGLSPRQVQQAEACRRALRRGGPNVLLLARAATSTASSPCSTR